MGALRPPTRSGGRRPRWRSETGRVEGEFGGYQFRPPGAALVNPVPKSQERFVSSNRLPSPKIGFLKLAFVGSDQLM